MGAGVIGPDSGTFLAMSTKLPFLRNRPIVPASVTVIKIHGNHMKIRPRRVFVLQRKTQGLVKSHNDELERVETQDADEKIAGLVPAFALSLLWRESGSSPFNPASR